MNARVRWLTTQGLAAMFGCLAGIAAAQNASAPTAPQFELPPIENLQATRERPLFTSARRPPSIMAARSAPPPIVESVALPFELTGIAVGDDLRIAILRNKTTNEELRLRQGDKLDEWILDQVADRYILLHGEGRRVRVWLVSNAKPPGIEVRQVDGSEENESTAAVPPSGEVDQEVAPTTSPSARSPAPLPVPPPVTNRPLRPPMPARPRPAMRPEAMRPVHRD